MKARLSGLNEETGCHFRNTPVIVQINNAKEERTLLKKLPQPTTDEDEVKVIFEDIKVEFNPEEEQDEEPFEEESDADDYDLGGYDDDDSDDEEDLLQAELAKIKAEREKAQAKARDAQANARVEGEEGAQQAQTQVEGAQGRYIRLGVTVIVKQGRKWRVKARHKRQSRCRGSQGRRK